jgi:hypothetical protein
MKLAETYALQCGLLIDKPYISKKFFPLAFDHSKIILIHAGGGNDKFPAKIYDHFDEVVSLLKPVLDPLGYRFIQIGGKGERALREVISLCGETTFQQSAFLLANAALFIGNDSMNAHVRAAEKMPSIVLFGPTSVREHGPYWKCDKNICLESHRSGKKPSFSAQENVKTINFIPPETIANKALSLLGLNNIIKQQTLFIGDSYQEMLIEIVPDHVPNQKFMKDAIFTLRMDYLFNETAIEQMANHRRINLITNKAIDLNLLSAYKRNITGVIQEINMDTDPEYIEKLKRVGIKIALFCREKDEAKLNELRFKFYDYFNVEQFFEKTKENFFNDADTFLNSPLDKNLKLTDTYFKSNKFLLSDGKIYLSKAHYYAEKPAESFVENTGVVIDHPDFWIEQDNMLIFKNE